MSHENQCWLPASPVPPCSQEPAVSSEFCLLIQVHVDLLEASGSQTARCLVQEAGWPSRSLAALPSDCYLLILFLRSSSICPYKEA